MTTSESPTHPDAPRAGGETPDIDRSALDLPAFKELLGEFAASVRGDERGYDVREFITKAREALIRYVEELHAEAIAKTIWRSRESDERAGEVDYDAADFTANEMLDDPSTPSAEWNLADAYLALRAALLERHRDGERWRALVAVLDLESMRTPEPGALILWTMRSNQWDAPKASIQSIAWRAPSRTLWIEEAETINEAMDCMLATSAERA